MGTEINSKKIFESLVAGAGVLLSFETKSLSQIHPLLPYLFTLVTVSMIMNPSLVELVEICRIKHRFAWEVKKVRTDFFFLAGTTLIVWGILFFTR